MFPLKSKPASDILNPKQRRFILLLCYIGLYFFSQLMTCWGWVLSYFDATGDAGGGAPQGVSTGNRQQDKNRALITMVMGSFTRSSLDKKIKDSHLFIHKTVQAELKPRQSHPSVLVLFSDELK